MRVTEMNNSLTEGIDVASNTGIARLLRQSDSQVFSGWGGLPGINDEEVLRVLEGIVDVTSKALKEVKESEGKRGKILVLMSGAGTSGRIGFICARAWNNFVSQHASTISPVSITFDYLMAGHDIALIKSTEAVEDDTKVAVEALVEAIGDASQYHKIVFFGITCGLSAPFVGAQIDWLLNQSDKKYVSVMIGFNPVSVARRVPVEGWDKTVYDVVQRLHTASIEEATKAHNYILNPVYGPEPISGSTRMKGGTVTKILLDSLFAMFFYKSFGIVLAPELGSNLSKIEDVFMVYEWVNRYTYLNESRIGEAIELGGRSLSSNRSIYYVASSEVGILGQVDASECPPTYGAAYSDIRGIVIGGWEAFKNKDGNLEKSVESSINSDLLSEMHFKNYVVPRLTADDTVVFFNHPLEKHEDAEIVQALLEEVRKLPTLPQIATVSWSLSSSPAPVVHKHGNEVAIHVSIPCFSIMPGYPAFISMSAKFIFNAISTGAHIKKGKVYKNVMIDVSLSNNKLFERAILMVSNLVSVDFEAARTAVLKSIYRQDEVSDAMNNTPISAHNKVAVKTPKVVPVALLLASKKVNTVAEALKALDADPIVRNIIQDVVQRIK